MRYAMVRSFLGWRVLDTTAENAVVKEIEAPSEDVRVFDCVRAYTVAMNRREAICRLILKNGDSARYRRRLREMQAEIDRLEVR
jgi:hypothetical protein